MVVGAVFLTGHGVAWALPETAAPADSSDLVVEALPITGDDDVDFPDPPPEGGELAATDSGGLQEAGTVAADGTEGEATYVETAATAPLTDEWADGAVETPSEDGGESAPLFEDSPPTAGPLLASETVAPAPETSVAREEEVAEESDDEEPDHTGRIGLDYFAIVYGPSISKPSAYQPTPYGQRDPDRPVEIRNFGSFSYNITHDIAIAPTVFWSWIAGQQQFTMHDPFLRVSHDSVFSTDLLNLYADARIHLPVSQESRDNHQFLGLQSLQSLTCGLGDSPFALGLYSSVRTNFFGDGGFGNDFELYLGPNLYVQFARHASLSFLYELQYNHQFGEKAFHFWTPGADFAPGVAWDVTPEVMLNPYLVLNTSGVVSLASTSFGMLMNWRLF